MNVYQPSHYAKDSAADIEAVIDGLPAAEAAHLWNILKYWERRNDKGSKAEDLKKANNYAHRLVYGKWRDERKLCRKSKTSTGKTVPVLSADGTSSRITAASGAIRGGNMKPVRCGKNQ